MHRSIYSDLISLDNETTIGVNYYTREISIIKDTVDNIQGNASNYKDNHTTLFTNKTPQEEFTEFIKWVDTQSADLSSLCIIWALTNKCNLACVYCFQDGSFKNRNERFSKRTKDDILSIFRSYQEHFNTKNFRISFYGGEPTLRSREVVESIDFFNESGLKIKFGIFTNGYQIPNDLFNAIVNNDFTFVQITIDGEDYYHNKQRPTLVGGGSFKQVFSSLVRLLESNVNVLLTMNFHSDNVKSIIAFLENNKFLRDFPSLEIAFSPILITRYKEPLLGKRKKWKEIGRDWQNLILCSRRLGYNTNLYRLFYRGLCTYYSLNKFILDPMGNIYKCIGLAGNKSFCIGKISAMLNDPVGFTLKLKKAITKPFLRNSKCHSCKFLPICLGGCRFQAVEEQFSVQEIYCHNDLIEALNSELIRYAVSDRIGR